MRYTENLPFQNSNESRLVLRTMLCLFFGDTLAVHPETSASWELPCNSVLTWCILSLLFVLDTTHFYVLSTALWLPTPNHLHSYVPNAQTISICHTTPTQPHSEHLKTVWDRFLSFRDTPHIHLTTFPGCVDFLLLSLMPLPWCIQKLR